MEKPKRRKKEDGIASSSMDRISELPEPIKQHILCFLSQNEAVQTCVISKSWRHLWCGRPIIEFQQKLFRGNYEKTFLRIIDQTLHRYYLQNLSIKQFVVKMSSFDHTEFTLLLEKWIPVLSKYLGVQTFRLVLLRRHYYALPWTRLIFQAESLKEIYLWGCKIKSTDDKQPCLNHLKTLSLYNVYIEDDETMEKILASCPLIQHVDLYMCMGLTTVKVNNIKHFDCFGSTKSIEIKVPSALETIHVNTSGLNMYLHHTDNSHFPRLKSFCLRDVHLSEEFPVIFSCNSPFLEDFELRNCSGFSQVNISSRSVKRLIIVDTKKQIETITIDASGILYFEYSFPSSVPSTSLLNVSFTTAASREWKSNISIPFHFQSYDIDIFPCFLELNEVLKALRQSRITLNLHCNTLTTRQIEKANYVNCYEPVVVEDLNLEGYSPYVDFEALFNSLFWIFRPIYIYKEMYQENQSLRYLQIDKLAEFVWKANHKGGEFSWCYFWQQELKELRLELLDHDLKKWCLVLPRARFPVIASPEIHVIYRIRFVFDWSESV